MAAEGRGVLTCQHIGVRCGLHSLQNLAQSTVCVRFWTDALDSALHSNSHIRSALMDQMETGGRTSNVPVLEEIDLTLRAKERMNLNSN